ncbi:MAG: tRNA pseudouridine(13) synthase TruD [Helicobacteraceae bacterium]|jgi:tRNA pseudouridine13 synthase|nr:tRNA pseudouridine(13) synthase TruD [Helicobacteraceae bacterium]
MQKRGFFLTHSPINAHFAQNAKDFVVEEISLYEPSGAGDHLFVKIRKKGVSTWEAAQIFSERIGVKTRDIGYAGLKDKNAMCVQTLSFPAKFESAIAAFEHEAIKILDVKRHNNKLKIGHLKGNRFFIRLKKVGAIEAKKLDAAIKEIAQSGAPNFFGFQRFGLGGDNYEKARAFLDGEAKIRGRKMQKFLINALQSERFNAWLTRRIELSHAIRGFGADKIASEYGFNAETIKELNSQKQFFRLLRGDIMLHYPHGKLYVANEPIKEAERFAAKQTAPTGVLSGSQVMLAEDLAAAIENEFLEDIPTSGDRRYAWIFPEELKGEYVAQEAHYELGFYLPKGSYATTLIEELLHSELSVDSSRQN